MTKTLRPATLITTLACALPIAVLAQQAQPAQPTAPGASATEIAFQRADSNADGKLSKAEAARLPSVGSKFDALDKDKDGSLSMTEYMAAFDAPKQ
jgi:EF hand